MHTGGRALNLNRKSREASATRMWDSEKAVEAEELPVSSGQPPIILQIPAEIHQPSLTEGALPVCGSELEGETEKAGGGREIMEHSVEEQNNFAVQRKSCPVVETTASLLCSNATHQQVPCQTGETQHPGTYQQNYESDIPSPQPDAHLDPDYDPDINPDGDFQSSCSFSCQQCKRRFNSRRSLELHAATSCPTHVFKCRHCRKVFSTQFGRRRHERRHDNVKRRTGCFMVRASPKGEGEIPKVASSQERRRSSQPVTNSSMPDSKGRGDSDGSREKKGSFVCKYCKKAFGTHTSLRRHERRTHERHLLPRGACQKVTGFDKPGGVSDNSSAANILHEEEGEQEQEYMVDISSNISENLSFYIDGKVISTSAITNCEVMEVNSGAASVIGLDALIISPSQFTQALKLDTNDCSSTSDFPGQPSGRRRTSTPPLLPQIKTELESESILTTSSSSSGATLIGTVLPQPLESTVLQKEKTIYLSPKLKQLLQNQESSKSTFALITEGQKLVSPLSLALLPASSSRFKRRTMSPPNSSQQSSAPGLKTTTTQEGVSSAPKLPKIESIHASPVISSCKKDEVETVSLASNNTAANIQHVLPLDCSATGTGGRSCNQQPLDLSSAVGKREDEILAESVLDLSTGRKSTEFDMAGTSQVPIRRTKPNSDMLEKVLLNQYSGVDAPAVADAGVLSAPLVPDLAVMAVAEPVPVNHEGIMFELSLPSPTTLHTAPPVLNPAVLHAAPPAQLPTEVFTSLPTSMPNHELHPLCSTVQSTIHVVPTTTVEMSAENSLAAFNVSLPDWLNSAPAGLTHTLIPTSPSLSLQGSQFLTDQSVCELAQRTLVVDSVLSPDARIFSPSLSVNQSNITPLSFPPNVVVIEYTVALEPTDASPVLQADQTPLPHVDSQDLHPSPQPQAAAIEPAAPDQEQAIAIEPSVQEMALPSATPAGLLEEPATTVLVSPGLHIPGTTETKVEPADSSACSDHLKAETSDRSAQDKHLSEDPSPLPPLCKRFMCSACDEPFHSIKGLSQHIGEHSETWPYKCEFCVQLFESDKGLLEHRSSYHGVGKIYVCRICSKEFAFLCNLEQHHRDVHPGQECSHTEVENGKLRPENHNSPVRADTVSPVSPTECKNESYDSPEKTEDAKDSDNSTEELYTTIKIMASEGVKPKGTDVRLGINQHYPSFKPPPFPYHNQTPAGSAAATATNFTTHNIPQTFSTAIRCTKCGKSFDNMPELHKHILACANASDKKRYTPKRNPIPLKQFARAQHGVLSPAKGVNSRQNVSQKFAQPKKTSCPETAAKVKLSAHSKKKSVWVQRGRTVGRKGSQDELEVYVCPYCSRDFTYHTSLKKHMVISCPTKPVCRKSKKRKGGMALAQENNGSIRTRTADAMKPRRSNQGQKTLTKAQITVSGSAGDDSLPLKAHMGKGKITVHNFRPKRSDILSTSVVHISKKSKPVLMEDLQSPLASNKSPTVQGKLQPGIRMQGIGREMKQREVGLSPLPIVEQQFSLRVKERTGGPITRSLQQANTTNRKGVTITPAKHPVQADRPNASALPAAIESNK